MRFAGIAPSFEQAKAELQENWEKWLAWANLQDIGGAVPLQPASAPVASEEIAGKVPLQPEPTAASDLAQRSTETSPEPAKIGQSAGAGRQASPRRRKSR